MAFSTVWWLLAGATVAVELATGTFYLLMLSFGFAAAAMASYLGFAVPLQITVAALVGAGSVLALWRFKGSKVPTANASANRDVNLDIGETVQVEAWNPDGTATVKYRGAAWTVNGVAGLPMQVGPHRVVEVIGNRLIVQHAS